MVNLPSVPRRGEVLQGPSSSVSPGTIASPYATIANALGGLGDKLEERAVADFEVRGQNAITRDAEGNLTVSLMPNTSRAAMAYNRAASQAFMARLDGDMRTAALGFAQQANGDVETFDAAWVAYAERITANAPEEIRGGVAQMLDAIGGAQHRGIVDARHTADMREFRDTITAQRERLETEMLSLAMRGMVGSPEYQRLQADHAALGQELVGNPAFGVSQAGQDWADAQFRSQVMVEAVVHDVFARYPMNPTEGIAYAEEQLSRAEGLSPTEYRRAMTAIRQGYTAEGAAWRVAVDQLTTQVDDLIDRIDERLPYDRALPASLIAEAQRLNSPVQQSRIEYALALASGVDAFQALPPDQQLAVWNETVGAVTGVPAPEVLSFLTERRIGGGVNVEGLNPQAASVFARALALGEAATGQRAVITSGHRTEEHQAQLYANSTVRPDYPNPVVHDGVTYYADPNNPVGTAARPGHSRHQHGNAVDLAAGPVLDWLHAHAAELGVEFLPASARDPGHMQLPGGGAGGAPTQGSTELLGAMRDELSVTLTRTLDQIDTIIGGGGIIRNDDAAFIVELASAVRDDALSARAIGMFYEAAGAGLARGGLTESEAARYAAMIPLGDGTELGEDYLATRLAQGAAQQRAYLERLHEENPALEGQARDLYELQPIDFTNAQTMAATLSQRQNDLDLLSADQEYGQQRLLEPHEATTLARALEAAPLDQKIATLGAMRDALRPDAYLATLGQISDHAPTLALAADIAQRTGSDEVLRRVLAEQQLAAEPGYRPPSRQPAPEQGVIGKTYGAAFTALQAQIGARTDIAWLLFLNLSRERAVLPDVSTAIGEELYGRALQMAAGATFEGGTQRGGVGAVNGQSVLLPTGMSEREVAAAVTNLTDDDLAALGGPPASFNGVPMDAADFHDLRLIAVGDGVYVVGRGLGEATDDPLLATRDDGELWMLDIRALQEAQVARRPGVLDRFIENVGQSDRAAAPVATAENAARAEIFDNLPPVEQLTGGDFDIVSAAMREAGIAVGTTTELVNLLAQHYGVAQSVIRDRINR